MSRPSMCNFLNPLVIFTFSVQIFPSTFHSIPVFPLNRASQAHQALRQSAVLPRYCSTTLPITTHRQTCPQHSCFFVFHFSKLKAGTQGNKMIVYDWLLLSIVHIMHNTPPPSRPLPRAILARFERRCKISPLLLKSPILSNHPTFVPKME
jgi:hypothetical protein